MADRRNDADVKNVEAILVTGLADEYFSAVLGTNALSSR